MGLVNPIKVYVATSNVKAEMICRVLQAADIEAHSVEDNSPAGWFVGGTNPGMLRADVFVSQADAEHAAEVLQQHERQEAERAKAQDAEIETICEDCGKSASFPAIQRGTVQSCPHCDAFIDVGEEEDLNWGEEEAG